MGNRLGEVRVVRHTRNHYTQRPVSSLYKEDSNLLAVGYETVRVNRNFEAVKDLNRGWVLALNDSL